MALPWPSGTPLLARSTSVAPSPPAADRTRDTAGRVATGLVTKVRDAVLSPTAALVLMLLGLALLFVLPLVGLPYLAVVVLPAVIYHLRAERRPRIPSARR